jgi:hypothetical protein
MDWQECLLVVGQYLRTSLVKWGAWQLGAEVYTENGHKKHNTPYLYIVVVFLQALLIPV